MSSHTLIGVLAIFTLLAIAGFSIFHFTFLHEPRNQGAAKNALVDGGESETAKVARGAGGGDQAGRPLKKRLDQSAASTHPDHPRLKKFGETRAA